jgi:starch synthase (maltosyl-transferring)
MPSKNLSFPKVENLVIENVRPNVDAGKYPIKREPMDTIRVEADIFRHGHEKFAAAICFRKKGSKKWSREPMEFVDNDLWAGEFQVKRIGFYEYAVEAWTLEPKDTPALSPVYEVRVDPLYARFSSWYEMFPRSQGENPYKSATWQDCTNRLDDIQAMGFDTIYLVPIHPIGETNRKGANNSLKAKPGEPGCPYAIGNKHGGHYAVDPDIGTMEEFDQFMEATRNYGFRMALDIALNCSPDHPHVEEHPEWYFHEPDGSIKFAENPPKKYEDIYPYDFWNENWQELWLEIRDMLLYWADKGFSIFRIDNPHTKPFAFWEWIIRDIKEKKPEVVFLAEAFTRPKLMHRLAKAGFDLSYTYFTWRNEKWELQEYLEELTNKPASEYMRGMFFPTTPDIFPEPLWGAGPESFKIRLFLSATLSSVWGMYNGYELVENEKNPTKEELYHSEKYQYKTHDWDSPVNIKTFISKVNHIRQDFPAMAEYDNLTFHKVENPNIMVYSKTLKGTDSTVLCVVNLDPKNKQSGILHLDWQALGFEHEPGEYAVLDLLSDESYLWRGSVNYVELDPEREVAHIFAIRTF